MLGGYWQAVAELGRVRAAEALATVAAPGPSGEPIEVELLADSGAVYALLPETIWRRLGLRPTRRMRSSMADLTSLVRWVSERYSDLGPIEGERVAGHTPVSLGGGEDVALPGVVTLERLGLVLSPLERSMHEAAVLPLMRMSASGQAVGGSEAASAGSPRRRANPGFSFP